MNAIPREVVQRILLSCDFGAWCCARFVCSTWAKICAENNWKTDEFAQYKFRNMTSIDYLLGRSCSAYYDPYLPNGLRHGLTYKYFDESEIIFKMELWVYGEKMLTVKYNYSTHLAYDLDFTIDNTRAMFMLGLVKPIVIILGNKFRRIEL